MTKTSSCPDCGSAPTNHFFARITAVANHVRMRKFPLTEGLRQFFMDWLTPHTDTVALMLIRIAVFIRLGKMMGAPDEKTCGRGAFLWEKAPQRGIVMKEFRLFGKPVDTYIATFKNETVLFEGLPRPNGKPSPALDWMDNKAMIRKNFVPAGIPMAKGGVVRTEKEILEMWNSLPKPVITKPHIGSRSRHTTIHISTTKELQSAVNKVKQLSPWVIMEQELKGLQYRGTVIGGKTRAVLRRDPACVIGDGKLTVRQLLEKENKNPKRQGPIFHTIEISEKIEKELVRQNLTWDSIPTKDQYVELDTKASRGSGGGTTDVTTQTHPDNIALFEKIAVLLNDPIVGVDFIISDISRSWKEQEACGVIECNSVPFIDLHKNPLVGETQDPASPIWDVVFPESK
jgi:D-alanine-D-alanine ligase-like ATP-grasp enzyme